MPTPFEGGCLCRAIRYRCAAEPLIMLNCFCRDCQYASGGSCTSALVVAEDSLSIQGTPADFTSKADSGNTVHRLFCRDCGSPLFAKNDMTSGMIAIKAATLDDPSWFNPAVHIWTASAPPWARPSDDLPKFDRGIAES